MAQFVLLFAHHKLRHATIISTINLPDLRADDDYMRAVCFVSHSSPVSPCYSIQANVAFFCAD